MRLAVPVFILVLAASMPAYAMPYGAPKTFPDIEQRSPAPGLIGWAIKGLVEGGEEIAELVHEHRSHHHKRDFLDPRAERTQLLQLRSQAINYKRALDHLLELNERDLKAEAATYDH